MLVESLLSDRFETSLDDTVALVIGGTRTVGEGITRMLLKCGASVVVSSHDREQLRALKNRIAPADQDHLLCVSANASKQIGAQEVRRTIDRDFEGQLDLVVAAVDNEDRGRTLKDLKLDTWNRLIDRHLTSHLVLAKTFLPLLQNGGQYLVIGRTAGQDSSLGTGPLSAIEAAKRALARSLAAEEEGSGATVTELVLGPLWPPDQENEHDGGITAEEVGLFVASLVETSSQEDIGDTIHLSNRMGLMEELQKLPIFDS
jgi:NAD(P)-dependent dehydrogenase (short-subunit alcohol dehydrogenase family)